MEINMQTKIGELLDAYPALEDTLLSLSPAFAKLRNPVLRRTVARVATVQQAAKIAGIPPSTMIMALREAAGLTAAPSECCGGGGAESAGAAGQDEVRPEWFDESKIAVRFDASPVIEAGDSPMSEILRLSKGLAVGGIMELSAPFRPEPIMDILRSKGFGVWYEGGKAYFLKQ